MEAAGGAQFSVARLSDGGLAAWGLNNFGQCNYPPLPGGATFVSIVTGVTHAVARLSGGSVAACDGALHKEFLAYVDRHPGTLGAPFAAGQAINAPGWHRDPAAPGATNLSNGAELVLTP